MFYFHKLFVIYKFNSFQVDLDVNGKIVAVIRDPVELNEKTEAHPIEEVIQAYQLKFKKA